MSRSIFRSDTRSFAFLISRSWSLPSPSCIFLLRTELEEYPSHCISHLSFSESGSAGTVKERSGTCTWTSCGHPWDMNDRPRDRSCTHWIHTRHIHAACKARKFFLVHRLDLKVFNSEEEVLLLLWSQDKILKHIDIIFTLSVLHWPSIVQKHIHEMIGFRYEGWIPSQWYDIAEMFIPQPLYVIWRKESFIRNNLAFLNTRHINCLWHCWNIIYCAWEEFLWMWELFSLRRITS